MEHLLRRSTLARPCPELEHFKSSVGVEEFRAMQNFIQHYRAGAIDPDKVPTPACFTCNNSTGNLHMCMQCVFVGCRKLGHLRDHFAQSSHCLAVDMVTDEIYCAKCQNYVFDWELSGIIREQRHNAHLFRHAVDNHDQSAATVVDWKPVPAELEVIRKHSRAVKTPSHLLGLRGLNNLGATCFMNVILQSFVHNPLLRGFFLSDRHNRNHCELSMQKKFCLACETDILFDSMFSGHHAPFSPHHFLFTTWKCSDHLAGYDQQDAHEFFIASIDKIHSHCSDQRRLRLEQQRQQQQLNGPSGTDPVKKDPDAMEVDTPSKASGDSNCKCIIHNIFSGLLRSDVVCQRCKKGSTAYDPFFDISLDISAPSDQGNEHAPAIGGDPDGAHITLLDCLRKFTLPESLENFECQACRSKSMSTKQLSMNTLPVVICFHLKRFKQLSLISSASTKIDTHVEFPQTLDMGPFLSASMVENASSPAPPQLYDLFCVVNHHGKIDNGHYTCFVRHSVDTWYKCDDHVITKASAAEVVRSRGYLLFYVRQNLNMNSDALSF